MIVTDLCGGRGNPGERGRGRVSVGRTRMTVAWILKDKGRHVVSVLSGTPITEAIVLLEKNRIGAIVIVDEQHHVQGILSERDIVRILATHGTSALNEPVSQHMTHPVSTCSEHHSIDWVMNEMTNHRFRLS